MISEASLAIRTRSVEACTLCARPGDVLYTGVHDRNLFIPGSWSVRLCQHCAIAWLDPQPIPEDVGLTYEGAYYTHSRELQPVSLGRDSLRRALRGAVLSSRYGYSHLRPQIPFANPLGRLLSLIPVAHRRATLGWLRAIPPYRPNGRLLEIGCGDGNYLFPMHELGWEVHAIEPDPVAAEKAAQAVDVKIWPGSVETAQVPEGTFDAVVSQHSIEHVYDPAIFVKRAASFLRPGGFLYVVTPNFASLSRRRFGQDWFAMEVPRHLNLLTPTSLRSICEATNLLRVHSVRTLTRRAFREQEHAHAVRKTGNFHADFKPNLAQAATIAWFGLLEKAGNQFFQWGEEVEVIAYRR